MLEKISFRLNGKSVQIKTDSERMLLWILRTEFELTGAKYSCGEGYCGACTVLVDNNPVRACQYTVKEASGKSILTIEGLEKNGKLHPLQQAFLDHNAVQCGFCTPGMILTAYSLLQNNPRPSREDIVSALEDNYCRCGTHNRIIQAVQSARASMMQGEDK